MVRHCFLFITLAFNKTHDMKNTIVLIGLMLVAVAGFSQMSKADAAGFLTRNPVGNCTGFVVWNTQMMLSDRIVGTKNSYSKEEIVSLTALESGFSLLIKSESGNKEKFFPYASVKYFIVAGDNTMNLYLRD